MNYQIALVEGHTKRLPSYRIDVDYSTPHNCTEAAPEEADNAEPPSMT